MPGNLANRQREGGSTEKSLHDDGVVVAEVGDKDGQLSCGWLEKRENL